MFWPISQSNNFNYIKEQMLVVADPNISQGWAQYLHMAQTATQIF